MNFMLRKKIKALLLALCFVVILIFCFSEIPIKYEYESGGNALVFSSESESQAFLGKSIEFSLDALHVSITGIINRAYSTNVMMLRIELKGKKKIQGWKIVFIEAQEALPITEDEFISKIINEVEKTIHIAERPRVFLAEHLRTRFLTLHPLSMSYEQFSATQNGD